MEGIKLTNSEIDEFGNRDESELLIFHGTSGKLGFWWKEQNLQLVIPVACHQLTAFDSDPDGEKRATLYRRTRAKLSTQIFFLHNYELCNNWESHPITNKTIFLRNFITSVEWLVAILIQKIKTVFSWRNEFQHRNNSILLTFFRFSGLSLYWIKDQNGRCLSEKLHHKYETFEPIFVGTSQAESYWGKIVWNPEKS